MQLAELREALKDAESQKKHLGHLLDNVLYDILDIIPVRIELRKCHAKINKLKADINDAVRNEMPDHLLQITGKKL